MRKLVVLCLAGYVISGGVAHAATYYTSKAGSNNNSGTEASPFQTVTYGVSRLAAGDTLLVRGGDYYEALINGVPSGTSWSSKIRIAAYPGETVWLRPVTTSFVVYLDQTQRYVEFDGINMDGSTVVNGVIKIEGWSGGNPHHIRFKNAEVVGNPNIWSQHIIVTGSAPGIIGGNEFINLRIHGGGMNDFDHGFYVQSSDNIIDGCEIYDIPGMGIQIYNGYGYTVVNTVVRNTIIRNARRLFAGQRHAGIIVANGAIGTKIYNNLIYGMVNDGGGTAAISVFAGTGAEVYNNTFYGNDGEGFAIEGGVTNTVFKNNISFQNSAGNYRNNGTGTVSSNNLIGVNPQFVNASAGNFRILASSPAINVAETIAMVASDLTGMARPQGGAYDIGAFEFGSEGSLRAPANVQIVQN